MKNAKVFNLIKLGLIIFTFFGFFLFFPGTDPIVMAGPILPDIKDPLIFKPEIGLPGLVDKGQQITLSNKDTSYIAQMVKGFYNYGIGIAGILAAIVLMAGGIIWLTSAGSSEKISQAKGLITGSLTGLLLVFGSWLILKTVNPYLVDFKIRDIKGVVPIFIEDGKDGVVDGVGSLPADTVIKFVCLGRDQTCLDTSPPSIQLDISICKKKLGYKFSCDQSSSLPMITCCATSEEINKEMNQRCVNKEKGTHCQVTPTDTSFSGFCHDNKCDGEKICCLCGQGCVVTGLCLYEIIIIWSK